MKLAKRSLFTLLKGALLYNVIEDIAIFHSLPSDAVTLLLTFAAQQQLGLTTLLLESLARPSTTAPRQFSDTIALLRERQLIVLSDGLPTMTKGGIEVLQDLAAAHRLEIACVLGDSLRGSQAS
ncbi:hypothetical protein [uncultured Hymenobacter sp.]|uniref:hypothetical protein n=1 Tax=uncultured Hymenobacter sp. TaxID=170016 RepID=UPI0035CB7E24